MGALYSAFSGLLHIQCIIMYKVQHTCTYMDIEHYYKTRIDKRETENIEINYINQM